MARANNEDLLMEDDLAAAFLGGEDDLSAEKARGKNRSGEFFSFGENSLPFGAICGSI